MAEKELIVCKQIEDKVKSEREKIWKERVASTARMIYVGLNPVFEETPETMVAHSKEAINRAIILEKMIDETL